jgi:hypothetical protein
MITYRTVHFTTYWYEDGQQIGKHDALDTSCFLRLWCEYQDQLDHDTMNKKFIKP